MGTSSVFVEILFEKKRKEGRKKKRNSFEKGVDKLRSIKRIIIQMRDVCFYSIPFFSIFPARAFLMPSPRINLKCSSNASGNCFIKFGERIYH